MARDPLTQKYRPLFARHLHDGEAIALAALAQHVQAAESGGRGVGEGVLAVTSQRVLFVDEQSGDVRMAMDRSGLASAKSSWIIAPGMRELKLVAVDGSKANFYASKRLCREVASLFA